jgi:endonuclease/exonuclease/phosphatase family metal-dependent hydrolase
VYQTNLRILTYNIHKGFNSTNRRFVLHAIKEALQNIDADIVFLQEIHGESTKPNNRFDDWPTSSQFEYLADSIWRHHAYGKNAVYRTGHHGNAILSKYPIVEWENIDVSLMRTASRSLLHAAIEAPGLPQKLHLICVHLGLFNMEREMQLSTLAKRIDSHVPHHEPLIIAGDFNDWRGRAERHLTSELGVSEVFMQTHGGYARSFPAWMPVLTMDRIYSRGLDLSQCQQLHGQPWRKLSDHIPLMAEFAVC